MMIQGKREFFGLAQRTLVLGLGVSREFSQFYLLTRLLIRGKFSCLCLIFNCFLYVSCNFKNPILYVDLFFLFFILFLMTIL